MLEHGTFLTGRYGGFSVGSLDLQGAADQLIYFNSSSTGVWAGLIMEESCKTGQAQPISFVFDVSRQNALVQ